MSDVIIIGAGPAGLSASISCARFGLKVLVIDEFMKPGGRLLGQLHQEPTGEWWNGIKESKRLHEEAESLSVHIRCGVSVYNLDRDENNWFVHTNIGTLEAPFVLLATGAAPIDITPGSVQPGRGIEYSAAPVASSTKGASNVPILVCTNQLFSSLSKL